LASCLQHVHSAISQFTSPHIIITVQRKENLECLLKHFCELSKSDLEHSLMIIIIYNSYIRALTDS